MHNLLTFAFVKNVNGKVLTNHYNVSKQCISLCCSQKKLELIQHIFSSTTLGMFLNLAKWLDFSFL